MQANNPHADKNGNDHSRRQSSIEPYYCGRQEELVFFLTFFASENVSKKFLAHANQQQQQQIHQQ